MRKKKEKNKKTSSLKSTRKEGGSEKEGRGGTRVALKSERKEE